jgi:RND family efflux transporter MFP subunit
MKNQKKILVNVLMTIIVGGLIYFLLALAKDDAALKNATRADISVDSTRYVRVQEVSDNAVETLFRFPGVTRAKQHASLTFLVSGTLAELPVTLGQRVEKGELLAQMYNPQLQPAADAARERVRELSTRMSQAKRDFQRVATLRDSGAASKQEYEQLESEINALKAGISAAKAQQAETERLLKETELHAPFAAVIDSIAFEVGEFVAAGQPMLALSGGGGLEVETQVPELMLSRLAQAQNVTVEFPYLDNVQLTGKLVELGQGAIGRGQLFPAVVSLPTHPDVRPGITAELVFVHVARDQLSVPVQAIIDPGSGQARLFVYKDGVVTKKIVEIVSIQGATVAVRSDLKSGDLVVIAGQGALVDGEAVEVVR